MKSQITSVTKGFLMGEIMLAFSLASLLITSSIVLSFTMDQLQVTAIKKLEQMEFIKNNLASTTVFREQLYGNDSTKKYFEPITFITSNYKNAWGRETCSARIDFRVEKVVLRTEITDLGAGNISTDIEVKNDIAYIATDSSTSAAPDLFIIDTKKSSIISSLNTGPGLSSLEVAGPYIYAANLSTANQLQVIDISNRANPVLVARYKLPLPEASTTPSRATAIFYRSGYVYLGTEKWNGDEFVILDVRTPNNPQYVGGFNTDTQINSIYVHGDSAYLAASDIGQIKILNISDPSHIHFESQFSPSGWETQVGKSLSYFEGQVSLGRTTGGFNVIKNHELFSFSSTSEQVNSRDIPGGVYGILNRDNLYIATKMPGHEFQVWNKNLDQMHFEKSLGFQPQAMTCDNDKLFFATGDRSGIAELIIN